MDEQVLRKFEGHVSDITVDLSLKKIVFKLVTDVISLNCYVKYQMLIHTFSNFDIIFNFRMEMNFANVGLWIANLDKISCKV